MSTENLLAENLLAVSLKCGGLFVWSGPGGKNEDVLTLGYAAQADELRRV
jgi:hypothetical protein